MYVAGIEKGSGADLGGIREGDVIQKLDGYEIGKFSDLAGYLGSKRPDDVVDVTVSRDGKMKVIPVTLVKLETYEIDYLGLEVKNASKTDLRERGVKNGVVVTKALTRDIAQYNLNGIVITGINDQKVSDIDDVKRIMSQRNYNAPIKVTFVNQQGELNTFIFR